VARRAVAAVHLGTEHERVVLAGGRWFERADVDVAPQRQRSDHRGGPVRHALPALGGLDVRGLGRGRRGSLCLLDRGGGGGRRRRRGGCRDGRLARLVGAAVGRAALGRVAAQAQGRTPLAGALEKVLGDLGQLGLRGRTSEYRYRGSLAAGQPVPAAAHVRGGICAHWPVTLCTSPRRPPSRGGPGPDPSRQGRSHGEPECEPLGTSVLNLPRSGPRRPLHFNVSDFTRSR
jgi:hypothetical protein